jgi:Na+/melibiose symporter-like transporter
MQLRDSQSSILWQQVWGLSAILAAFMFSWMAYNLYQPKILQELGFVKLATSLGIIQGFMGAALEPLVGAISDRIQRRFGSRLPLITTGVTLAGLIFVGTSILLQWQIPVGIRWLVPLLMTLWVMSMIVFRGPVIALLRQAAPLAVLPQANMVLTVIFGLVGALSPLMTVFLNSIGASITFILGAIALTIGATILYSSTPQTALFSTPESVQSSVSFVLTSIIFAVGLGVGLEINLLLRTFPPIIQTQISGISIDGIVSIILLISALLVC